MSADDGTPPSGSDSAGRRRSRDQQLRSPRDLLATGEDQPARRVARRGAHERDPEPDVPVDDEDVVDDVVDDEPAPEDAEEADPVPDQPTGTLGVVDDPEDSDLLRRWDAEEHFETLHPRRNWSPVLAVAAVVGIVGLIALAVGLARPDGDSGGAAGSRNGEAETNSVLDADAPSLDDLTADVTIPPGPDTGLSLADKGFTIVEDRFDPARREGTYAVIVVNPNLDWLAHGVQVDVEFLDEAGAAVGSDNAFIEVVLPGQKVAAATLFFDAPAVPVADLAVTMDVARWSETEPVAGTFETRDVVTEEAEFSGVRTRFVLRSGFDTVLNDVGVTVVYRNAFGGIIGGSDTFIDQLEPGVDTPAEIALLANISLDQVAVTELYPTASFGFAPEQDG